MVRLPTPTTAAEQMLLTGQGCHGADTGTLPDRKDETKGVRGEFLRALMLSRNDGAFSVCGIWIDGELDLEGLTLKARISFVSCVLGTVNLSGATILAISFSGCEIWRIDGASLNCAGNFELSSVKVEGGVNLPFARIGGTLNFSSGHFFGIDWVLNLDGVDAGEIDLRHVKKADRISLSGARTRVLHDDYQSWSTAPEGHASRSNS